ncbi:MAG: AhpC/TSA family protein [Tannerella sp.]|jgi:peroxiredoxin|nr:AhpC/TSA family protein [Tannerella sp.]
MNKKLTQSFVTVLIISALCGCVKDNTFTIKGVVAGSTGQTLYLENSGVTGIMVLDSLKLQSGGKFRFEHKRPAFPDFYRLRLNNQLIHFPIDSTETLIFTADVLNFHTSYTVEGSDNSKAFKDITLAQLDANEEIRKLRDSYGMNLIPDSVYQVNVLKAVNTYKDTVKKYVFGSPMSTSAYFALFQKIDGLWTYDLYDKADSKAYGAVATSYKTFMPDNPRSKQLETLALQSLKVRRGERQKQLDLQGKAQEINFIDIELPDIYDKKVKLSEIAHGKAVLVNFTAYQTEWSGMFNITLGDLYLKYKDKGFEIYQVSLDNDAHYWKNIAYNIPWISVRDPQSIYSTSAAVYNVRQLPALFLINSKGELVKRIESVETLDNDIKAAL